MSERLAADASDIINGPATRSKLERLWVSLLGALVKAMQEDKVSSEMMACVRMFLSDNSVKPTDKQVKQLQRLHEKLTARLLGLIESPESCTAGVLGVTRAFLADNNISKDVGGTVDVRSSLGMLADLDIPFTKH